MPWLLLLLACGPDTIGEPCTCDGHGVRICEGEACGPCMCLPLLEPSEDPEPTTTFWVDPDVQSGVGSAEEPWTSPDWQAIDEALIAGPVWVLFSAQEASGDGPDTWPERLELQRGDTGSHRLVLDGGATWNTDDGAPSWADAPADARARIPGITTGYEDVARSHITIRGFEVTGSDDKGIFVGAGDEVIIEDNLVHGNGGSPSISIDYVSRSGLPSSSFVVRNNHVWDQQGECVYIGGAEGEDLDAHASVVVENNLIHDCWKHLGTHHDGINIKDRIGAVRVSRNVIFHTDWGIEAASPGEYSHNIVWGTGRNGFHITDSWGAGLSGLWLHDNVSAWAGEAGLYLYAREHAASDVLVEGFTSSGASEAGIELGTEAGLEIVLRDVLVEHGEVGLDGWGGVQASVEGCRAEGNAVDADRDLEGTTCIAGATALTQPEAMAGEDGRFFTDDDPWLSPAGGAALP